MTKVFIDGSAGTTGLRIRERLSGRTDLELLTLSEDKRKDANARRDMLNTADIAFLCLPDAAAIEAVSLIESDHVAVIDTSTAHRVSEGWAYGFAELSRSHRQAIVNSKRVANPGCHASGFIAGVYPLVKHGVIPADFPLTAYSLTGYSGGGKKLIAEYEDENRDPRHESHRIYGTTLTHKHLPEMQKLCGLTQKPVFSPILGDFYAGMATSVLLPGIDANIVWEAMNDHYAGQKLVSVAPLGGDEAVVYASTYAGKDTMRIQVSGQRDQCMVTAIFDNLGKGASGAAIQNMNLLLGLDETTGLSL
ncbi:MAG: N-acetyl-gamma-glutamyl-phosphate reductase [Eubacteriales bacterium]|nr:N-acetyl-gamma-glutamyl-phosphate reductase [Eubacteriales bacterium]